MQKTQRRFVVMGFGLGGNHGDGRDADGTVFASSWYIKPADLQSYIDNGHYPAAEMENCILIDKRPAVEANPCFAYEAPMLGVNLAEGETSRLTDLMKNDCARMVTVAAAEQSPTIALLTVKAMTDTAFVGLDKVGPIAYADWWRDHGATIGCVKDGKVMWETRHAAVPA